MINSIISLLVLIAAAVFIYRGITGKSPQRSLRETKKAKLIYNGEHQSGYFASYRHRIRAKPDFMYLNRDGTVCIVEYKSRRSGIRRSDITQLIATAIAVKDDSQYDVRCGYVLTRGGSRQRVNLNKTTDELVSDIQTALHEARQIKKGNQPIPQPEHRKCRGCGFRQTCRYAK